MRDDDTDYNIGVSKKKTKTQAAQQNANFSLPLCVRPFLCSKNQRPRSNGRGDEKSRSRPRADRERKDVEIRGEDQMKANLL